MSNAGAWGRAARWGLVMLGGFILFWLPVEDSRFITIQIIAALLCGLAGAYLYFKRGWQFSTLQAAVYGSALGAAVTPAAAFFMLLKNGLHAHAAPDFDLADLQHVLQRAPVWALSGMMIALGISTLLHQKPSADD
jgi:hypothetical protein